MPSALTFLPTETYYTSLVYIMPLFLMLQWLMLSALTHLILRLLGRRSDLDQLLNIGGMAALVVGAWLVVWDWAYILVGGQDFYFLGISHLVFSIWGILITILGLRRILDVPVWLGLLLYLVNMVFGYPLNMIFVRPPV
jgi:hypothetical protein